MLSAEGIGILPHAVGQLHESGVWAAHSGSQHWTLSISRGSETM